MANDIQNCYLKKSDVGLEFGSSRSTLWFAQRVSRLTSVEHNEAWSVNIQDMLKNQGIDHVNYKIVTKDEEAGKACHENYVNIVDEFDNNSLDFCIVDGLYRDLCALKAVEKIRPGGLLVIDNANLYLPSESHSPNSRKLSDGPKGHVWKEIKMLISDWRRIWTSSGVTDTALFIKPC